MSGHDHKPTPDPVEPDTPEPITLPDEVVETLEKEPPPPDPIPDPGLL